MIDTISGVVVGAELAVFFVILIYVILLDTTSKNKIHPSINIFAGTLILISGIKFFIALLEIESAFEIELVISLLYLASGLSLISFLSYVGEHIEEYR